MAQPERYVFVCLNQRPEGHPKGSCLDRGAADVFNALREEQGRRLLTNVKVVASVAADVGAELAELDGEDDHVQRLVAYPPHVAVARL